MRDHVRTVTKDYPEPSSLSRYLQYNIKAAVDPSHPDPTRHVLANLHAYKVTWFGST